MNYCDWNKNLLAHGPEHVAVTVFSRSLHSTGTCSKCCCRGASIAGQVAGRGDALRGSYPKAEQPPYVTKKNLQGMIIFSNFFV